MTAIAAFNLLDGAATPVSHTFNPVNIDQAGVSRWVDRSGGIALGFPLVTFSMRQPTKANRNFKITGKVVLPVLEVTSPSTASGIQPAPTLGYNLSGTVEFVIPERSTDANRKDILAFVKNNLAASVMDAAVKTLESVY